MGAHITRVVFAAQALSRFIFWFVSRLAMAARVCRRCDGGVGRRTNVSNSGVLVTVAACAKRNIAGKIRRILVRRRRSGA
jgi:hypothetical protein